MGIKSVFVRHFQWLYYGLYNTVFVAKDLRYLFSCWSSKRLPRSTSFPHPIGIVIGTGSPIGENCTILQNVTIGVKNPSDTQSPKIGDRVFIGSGAVILGDIEIGDGVVIGANSVVLSDVPEGVVIAGSPAEVVSKQ
ncbi:serine O-acetyltransferase [Halomicroarcula sp. GCM10025743]|uniref:serine O-acetyltransferase n=1 Tax=Haloarcula TaxID=2237 RepID=UPI00360A194E